jgi:hypothetical protein
VSFKLPKNQKESDNQISPQTGVFNHQYQPLDNKVPSLIGSHSTNKLSTNSLPQFDPEQEDDGV